MKNIGIVSVKGDLHPQAVKNSILACDPSAAVYVFESSELSFGKNSFIQRFGKNCSEITCIDGISVDVGILDVVWWRRARTNQSSVANTENINVRNLVNRDCNDFLDGIFLASFSGKWVNMPNAASMAENKIYQLKLAHESGLLCPETIVSNNRKQVVSFLEDNDKNEFIVKTLSGIQGVSLLTKKISVDLINDPKYSVELSPAIYQEYVPGSRHLRVFIAGERVCAVEHLSTHTDSRIDLSTSMRIIELDRKTINSIRIFLGKLGLEMGIVDFKINLNGDLYFLEINQQGQFLYLDMICGSDLVGMMAKFLLYDC